MLRIPQEPRYTDAMAHYPYNEGIESAMTFLSKYGDEVNMSVRYGDSISIPRHYAGGIGKDFRIKRPMGAIVPAKPARNEMQVKCIKDSTSLLKTGISHILESPTGSGKTYMALAIACAIGEATLIVCTKSDLMDSWKKTLIELIGIPEKDIGIAQGDKLDYKGKRFVLGMVHSLAMEGKYDHEFLSAFGLVIFDETHRMAADTFQTVCQRIPARLRLGLSATPTRADGKNPVVLGHIGPVLVRGTIIPMSPKVIIQPTMFKAPSWISAGGKTTAYLSMLTKAFAAIEPRNQLIANFVESAFKKGRNTVIMSGSIEHLDRLHIAIGQRVGGDNIGRYVGGMSKDALQVGAHRRVVLATYQMCSEGTDFPHWDTLVMGTPKSDVTQIIGRVLRSKEDKLQPIVFDMVDHPSVYQAFARKRTSQYYKVGATLVRMPMHKVAA